MIEKLDEDFVKALRFFSGIFSFRFEILFIIMSSVSHSSLSLLGSLHCLVVVEKREKEIHVRERSEEHTSELQSLV